MVPLHHQEFQPGYDTERFWCAGPLTTAFLGMCHPDPALHVPPGMSGPPAAQVHWRKACGTPCFMAQAALCECSEVCLSFFRAATHTIPEANCLLTNTLQGKWQNREVMGNPSDAPLLSYTGTQTTMHSYEP